jgi:hypothetical protein
MFQEEEPAGHIEFPLERASELWLLKIFNTLLENLFF